MNLFAFGLGYSALCHIRTHRGACARIGGTVRSAEKRDALRKEGIEAFVFNPDHAEDGIASCLRDCDALLLGIAPQDARDPTLKAFGEELAAHPPQRIVYLSTIGVYGDHAGAWVDETSLTKPTNLRSQWRLEAENQWIAFAREHGCNLDIQRLSGIYGPGRNAIANLRAGRAHRIVKPGHVFNRIHVADIAQSIAACFARPLNRDVAIWNVTDSEPAPAQDVVLYAANLIGVEPPPEIAFDEAQMTPMARSFYDECKRASNRALREKLGVRLIHPNYREGLQSLLAQERAGQSAK